MFHHKIWLSIHFLQQFVADHSDDIAALARERDQVFRTVSWGLDVPETWPALYALVTTFSIHYIERQGQWTEWQQLLARTAGLVPRLGSPEQAITLGLLQARLYQRQSNGPAAIHHYRRVIRQARLAGDEISQARACSNLGYLFVEHHRWWRAEVLCCHALVIFERHAHTHGLAHTENHLGALDIRRRRWPEAEAHLKRACALWEAKEDHHSFIRGLINLGALFNEQARPKMAIPYLEKAFQQVEMTSEQAELGTIYLNLGTAYNLQGQVNQAERYARQAEQVYRKFGNSLGLARVWSNFGLIYVHLAQFDKAEDYLLTALTACRQAKNLYSEFNTHTYLIELALAQGQFDQAATRLVELAAFVETHRRSLPLAYTHQVLEDYRRRLDNQD
jgi:tetratricopeptide (TPR) repeat protein